jgi:mono/diheme cytochrome c family protein
MENATRSIAMTRSSRFVCVFLASCVITTFAKAQDSDLLERGRYLVEIAAFCGVCHTTPDSQGRMIPGMNLAGGRVLAERGFRAVVPNITPDPETGIGRWSDAQIIAAIREGRRPDGSIIGPPMPIELYRGLADRDVAAMTAYLRTVPAIRHPVTERSSYPFALRSYGPLIQSVAAPADDPVARGAYLAGPVAHCTDCHNAPLPDERRDSSRVGAGGLTFEGPWGVVAARNITPHRENGIGSWTDGEIIQAITKGLSRDGRRLAPPMSARALAYSQLAEQDLRDIVAYLRSLPPLP